MYTVTSTTTFVFASTFSASKHIVSIHEKIRNAFDVRC